MISHLYRRTVFIALVFSLFCATSDGQTLYWVGNGGQWSDSANWSLTSGGAGGAGVPDDTRSVIFDSNSGDCTIAAPAICNAINWDANNTISVNAELTVRDSLIHTGGNLATNAKLRIGTYQSIFGDRSISGSDRSFIITGDPGSFTVNTTTYTDFALDTLIFETGKGILESIGNPRINYLEFKGDGEVHGNHLINTWVFAAGRSVFLENGSVQKVFREFKTGDFCKGLAHVLAFLDNPEKAILQFENPLQDIEIRGFYFRRIRGENLINGNPETVFYVEGVDGGDNENMNATTVSSRTLYWVGGTGDWLDTSHWSLASGGAPGACVPTAADIVIFDDNSFITRSEDVVMSNAPVYVQEFRFEALNKIAFLRMPAVYLRHNLFLSGECFWDIEDLYIVGVDNTIDLSITTNKIPLGNIIFNSLRNVNLADNLSASSLIFEDFKTDAEFNSNGLDIGFSMFHAVESGMKIILSGSHIRGGIETTMMDLTKKDASIKIVDSQLETTNTLWDLGSFLNAAIHIKDVDMGTLHYNTRSRVPNFFRQNYLYLYAEGENTFTTLAINKDLSVFDGNITTDSLLFYSDNTYRLHPGGSITVSEHFECNGDICTPIELQSRIDTERSNIMMPTSATISMSNTNIKDINASGGNSFDAGNGSIDIGNNQGWTFRDPNATERDQFLGPDTMICNDIQGSFKVILDLPESQVDSIQWNGGETRVYQQGARLLQPGQGSSAQEYDIFARIVYSNGCSSFDTLHVILDEAFDVRLPNDTTLCNGASLTLTDLNNNPEVNYTWDDTETGETYLVEKAGDYTLVGQKGGCRSSATITVDQIDLTSISLDKDAILCDVSEYTIETPEDFAGTQVWQDGSTGDSLVVSSSGSYSVEFSQDVCSIRDTINVRIDPKVTVDLGADTVLCTAQTMVLSAGGNNNSTYSWSNDATTPAIQIDQGGTYLVTVTSGVCSASDTIVVSAVPQKKPYIGEDQTICNVDSLTLSVTPGYLGEYVWSTGETSRDIRINTPGEYILTLVESGCTISDTMVLSTEAAPVLELGNDTTLCAGESISLDATVSGDASYSWSNGETTPTLQVNTGETYVVTVNRGKCAVSDEIKVDLIEINDFSISGDSIACAGDTIILSSPVSGDGITYQWQDGSSNPEYRVTSQGTYELTVNLQSCTATASKDVNFRQKKSIEFGNSSTICASEEVILDPAIDNATYRWQDGSTNPTYTVTESGIYTVEVIDGPCISTGETEITIQPIPDLKIAEEDLINKCIGDSIILSADVPDITYSWQDQSTESQLVARQSGLYYATMKSGVCEVTDSVNITFYEYPDVELGEDRLACDGQSVTISAPEGDNYTYTWIGSPATTSSIEAKISGSYTVIVSNAGCESSDDVFVTIEPIPVFDLGRDRTICEGEEVTITATPAYPDLIWNIDASGSTVTTSQGGRIRATADLNGCSFTDSLLITVQEYPVVNIGRDTIICDGSSITLDATTEGATYEWSTGEDTPTILASNADSYEVTVDINGCSTSERIELMTKETPTFSLKEDETICEGTSTTVSINNPGTWDIEWSTGETTDQITISESGTYGVTATLDGCSSVDRYTLNIEQLPVFDLGEDFSKCGDITATLQVNVNNASVKWQDGSGGNTYTVSNAGLYTATATTPNGCTFMDDIEIANRACTGYEVYIANAFSPNGDARNDEFTISFPQEINVQQYELSIYDRWGGLLFKSTNINDSWKGLLQNGQIVPAGVYTYALRVTYSDDYETNATDTRTGTVLVVR